MAKKTNKTDHVLKLLAGDKAEQAAEDKKEPSSKKADAEAPPVQLNAPPVELPGNISVIHASGGENDPVADSIKEKLGELMEEMEREEGHRALPGTDTRPEPAETPSQNAGTESAAASVPSPDEMAQTRQEVVPEAAAADEETPRTPAPEQEATAEETSQTTAPEQEATAEEPSQTAAPEQEAMAGEASQTTAPEQEATVEETSRTTAPEQEATAEEPLQTIAPEQEATAEEPPQNSGSEQEAMAQDPQASMPEAGTAEEEMRQETSTVPDSAEPTGIPAPEAEAEQIGAVAYEQEEEEEREYAFVNVMERIVRDKVLMYMEQFGNCTCDRCYCDTVALTLTNLPSKYVVVNKSAVSPLFNFYSKKYAGQVIVEITKACIQVDKHPHHDPSEAN